MITHSIARPGIYLTKFLLYCGIISSIWYLAINIIVPLNYPGYDAASQAVSELSAIGAPTRALWVLLCSFYSALMIAFGWGVLKASRHKRAIQVAGDLLILSAVFNLAWPPMHQREVIAAGGGTITDTLHIVFTIITVVFMMIIIGLSATALGKWFRIYSIISIVLLLFFGIVTGLDAPAMESLQPTPWMGVWERISIGIYMLWIIMFALKLMHRRLK
jgi:hypothetical protein